MSVRKQRSNPAHLHSSLNWQPNDEKKEKFQKHTHRPINH